jgi:hypothetical protein
LRWQQATPDRTRFSLVEPRDHEIANLNRMLIICSLVITDHHNNLEVMSHHGSGPTTGDVITHLISLSSDSYSCKHIVKSAD